MQLSFLLRMNQDLVNSIVFTLPTAIEGFGFLFPKVLLIYYINTWTVFYIYYYILSSVISMKDYGIYDASCTVSCAMNNCKISVAYDNTFIYSPHYMRTAGHRQVYWVPLGSVDLCVVMEESRAVEGTERAMRVHDRLLFSYGICNICSHSTGHKNCYS